MSKLVSAILSDFRHDSGIPANQVSDVNLLRYYNDVRDEVVDRIVAEKEDFFYDEYVVDLVNGKREYVLAKRGDLAKDGVTVLDGILKIKAISVKFKSTDTDYTLIRPEAVSNLDYDSLSYGKTVSPFYVVSDNSVFLYPFPTEDISGGMRIYVIRRPKTLLSTDYETLDDTVGKVIIAGVSARAFSAQRKEDLASLWESKYEKKLKKLALSLAGRLNDPKPISLPTEILRLK